MSETIARLDLGTLADAATLPKARTGWPAESLSEGVAEQPASPPKVAVLIPCFNEEAAIGGVVAGFQTALPHAAIHVYDNNSTDRTVLAARRAGAIVRRERLQGKGHVVRRMFADIDADIYVLVDGDGTYDPTAAPSMLRLLLEAQLDMVTATRVPLDTLAYRRGHKFGNAALSGIVRLVFGNGVTDMLSGYRVFSRRFVKSFPALATQFETETEFTIHALALNMPVGEIRTAYRGRAAGTQSKLNTFADGFRILRAVLTLIGQERPLQSFTSAMLLFLAAGFALGGPVVSDFLETGQVPRLPTAVLATGLVLMGFTALGCGLVLDVVSRGRKEMKRLAYLAIPPVSGEAP